MTAKIARASPSHQKGFGRTSGKVYASLPRFSETRVGPCPARSVHGHARYRLPPPRVRVRHPRLANRPIRANRGGGAHDHLDAMNTGQAALTWLSACFRRSPCIGPARSAPRSPLSEGVSRQRLRLLVTRPSAQRPPEPPPQGTLQPHIVVVAELDCRHEVRTCSDGDVVTCASATECH